MKEKVIITDRMQRGDVYWRTEPVGRNLAPGFTPDLTPKEMLRLGILGGKYMRIAERGFHGAGSLAPGCAPSGMTRG
jgi:hypothetical protein